MQYIRDHYGVPAKRGGRIRYTGEQPAREGTIVASRGQYLKVRFDGSPTIWKLHPTWEVEYLPAAAAPQ